MDTGRTTIILNLISYDLARRVIDAGIAEADRRGVKLSFVIVDAAGHLVAAARMDGVPFVTTEVARGKAFACASTGGQPGRDLAERFRENPMVWGSAGPLGYGSQLFPAAGSFPIRLDGRLIGAIGASGAPSEIDEAVIAIAIAAIGADPVA